MKHLTDAQIQQVVFDQSGVADDSKLHIQHCAACSRRVEEYRLFFGELKALPEAAFDFNLEAMIMEQLPQPSINPKEGRGLLYGFAIICFLSVLSLIHFFGKDLVALFGGMELLLTGFIVTTALCVLVFLAVDMYRMYLKKMKALNF
jgi:hypothetical protein